MNQQQAMQELMDLRTRGILEECHEAMMELMPYWDEGYKAFNNGIGYSECPYPEGTEAAKSWQDGHSEAVSQVVDSLRSKGYDVIPVKNPHETTTQGETRMKPMRCLKVSYAYSTKECNYYTVISTCGDKVYRCCIQEWLAKRFADKWCNRNGIPADERAGLYIGEVFINR